MTGHSNHNDLIDSYLSGNMNAAQQADFEHLLEADPLLKEEFMFQKEIISGIKEFRKNQMKQRLNQITVGVGITGLLLNSGLSKVLAAVGTLGIIGVGSYFVSEALMEDSNKTVTQIEALDLTIDSPEEYKPETNQLTLNLPATNTAGEELANSNDRELVNTVPEEDQVITEMSTTANIEETNQIDNTINQSDNTEIADIDLSEKVKKANFSVPLLDEAGDDEETLDGIDITLPDNNQPVTTKEEASKEIEVENVSQTKYDLHYKFFSGKLFLYGDFNSIPYELLEINSGNHRSLYLYHDEVYYQLSQNEQRIVPLMPIDNQELIDELEIIRSNKID